MLSELPSNRTITQCPSLAWGSRPLVGENQNSFGSRTLSETHGQHLRLADHRIAPEFRERPGAVGAIGNALHLDLIAAAHAARGGVGRDYRRCVRRSANPRC